MCGSVKRVFPLLCRQIFEVATNTRIKDLILNVADKLSLASADGFSIFVKTDDKVQLSLGDSILNVSNPLVLNQYLFLFQVLSLNDTDYFFDSLRQITDWSKRAKRIKDGEASWCVVRSSGACGGS